MIRKKCSTYTHPCVTLRLHTLPGLIDGVDKETYNFVGQSGSLFSRKNVASRSVPPMAGHYF